VKEEREAKRQQKGSEREAKGIFRLHWCRLVCCRSCVHLCMCACGVHVCINLCSCEGQYRIYSFCLGIALLLTDLFISNEYFQFVIALLFWRPKQSFKFSPISKDLFGARFFFGTFDNGKRFLSINFG
jgi:hypothetical protein